MGKKLVCGVGINDADYIVQPNVMGKQIPCPYYQVWCSMLKRCYSTKRLNKFPTYRGCYVCEEWLTFSNFKAWMETQDWKGKHLDKDILTVDNKLYSRLHCVFVSDDVNLFVTDCRASRGKYMIGVSWHKASNKFISQCSNGDTVYLGLFSTELEAHLTWKAYKHQLACKLADEQTDLRVAAALRQRYL